MLNKTTNKDCCVLIITVTDCNENEHEKFEEEYKKNTKELFKKYKMKGRFYSNKTGEGMNFP